MVSNIQAFVRPMPPMLDILVSGDVLTKYIGEDDRNTLYSPLRYYKAMLHDDGNLAIYDIRNNNNSIWNAGTANIGVETLAIEDGRLIMKDVNGNPVREADARGVAGSVLSMEDDGRLVIKLGTTIYWSTPGGAFV